MTNKKTRNKNKQKQNAGILRFGQNDNHLGGASGAAKAVPFRSCLSARLRRFNYKCEKQIPCGNDNKKSKG
jgi:hypothetical protein